MTQGPETSHERRKIGAARAQPMNPLWRDGAGLQDDCGLSPRQPSGDCRSLPRLDAVLPGEGAVLGVLWHSTAQGSGLLRSSKRIMGRREIAEEASRPLISDCQTWQDESGAREPGEAPDATAAALGALKTPGRTRPRSGRARGRSARTLVKGEADARPVGLDRGPKPPSENAQTAIDPTWVSSSKHAVTNEPTTPDCFIRWPMRPRKPSVSSA
jgi:hypothetical protein